MFNRELHAAMDENDMNGRPLNNLEVVNHFMCSYCIESVSEDALLKTSIAGGRTYGNERYGENIKRG